MSKFFKALEQADRDRLQGAGPDDGQPLPSETRTEESPVPLSESTEEAATATEPVSEEDRARVDDHLVGLVAPSGHQAEEYRALQTFMEDLRGDRQCLVLALSSPVAGDGKTLTAINLAGTLAQSGKASVLLIDADLRQGSVSKRLSIEKKGTRGLTEIVAQPGLSLSEVILSTAWPNLSVLPAGRPANVPYQVLESPRLPLLIEEARKSFAYIVVDTPPLIPVSDCRVIEKWVDHFILVVNAHHTPRGFLLDALRILDPEKVAGIVYNSADLPPFGHAYYYYYTTPSERGSRLSRIVGRGGRSQPRA